MSAETFLGQAGIPLLLFVICIYYGIRLIVLQDVESVRGKNKEPVKDKKNYSKYGGILILLYGASTLVMAALLLVNLYIAVAQIVICTITFGILWKKLDNKYGA